MGKYGYTVAGYAATSPATSWFGILAILLLTLTIQIYYTNIPTDPSETTKLLTKASRVALSVFLLTFAFASPGNFCTFPDVYEVTWVVMGTAGGLYALLMVTVHVRHFQEETIHKVLSVLNLVACLAYAGMLLSGSLYDSGSHGLGLLPWVMECVALTSLTAIGPTKVWYMYYQQLQAANIQLQSRL